MFLAQTVGSIIGCFVNYAVLDQVISAKRPFLDGSQIDPTGQVSSSYTAVCWAGVAAEVNCSLAVGWPETFHFHECICDLGSCG
jgi:hypothetical protein